MSPGVRWIEIGIPGAHPSFGILAAADFPEKPALTDRATLHTTDLAKTRTELAEKGVEVSDLVTAPRGAFCTFTDPRRAPDHARRSPRVSKPGRISR